MGQTTAYPYLVIDLARQQLQCHLAQDREPLVFPVSTASRGPGEAQDSGCTPTGEHYIRAAIGADLPPGTVFVARRPTGETWTPALSAQFPARDWILSRILWLCGCESGKNRGPGVDSFRRFIYIHGTPDTEPMGVPLSHGCVRMRNDDVIELFQRVGAGTAVSIR